MISVMRSVFMFKSNGDEQFNEGLVFTSINHGRYFLSIIISNPNNSNNAPLDKNNAIDIYCARKSAKNILFTYIDTYIYASTHDAGEDDRYAVEVGVKTTTTVFAWWKPVLYSVDAVAGISIALVVFFMFKPKKVELEKEETLC